MPSSGDVVVVVGAGIVVVVVVVGAGVLVVVVVVDAGVLVVVVVVGASVLVVVVVVGASVLVVVVVGAGCGVGLLRLAGEVETNWEGEDEETVTGDAAHPLTAAWSLASPP